MALAASVVSPIRSTTSAPDAPRARILMVDDRPANLVALEATLAPLEVELVRASSGEEALRKLLEGDFAVILLDVEMPGLDGIATASLIRKRERTRGTAIIFLTAIAKDPSIVFRGYSEGAVDYLVKPLDADILRAKVSVFVELWNQREVIKRQQELLRAQELRELARRNEVRFRGVIESLPACVWVANRKGEIAYCNRAWQEYAGPAAGVAFFSSVPDDEAAEVRTAWREAVRAVQPLEREQRLRRRDGQFRWHLLRLVPETFPEGGTAGWIAAATDIDDRKRAEEAHASLLVREQQARAQAEMANRSKDEFLATVSHELRTPLNAILGWTRVLRSGAAPGSDKLQQALEAVERNARTQTQLIEDLLDVSRIVAGKLRVEMRPMDLVRAVREATDAVVAAAQARGLHIELRLPEDAPFQGDPERLKQVIWNLLCNAIKFTPAGTITVELRCEPRNVELVVTDTGVGIDPDFLPYVFDRFRQADSSLSRSAGGLGLGLAIVRHLVEVHGGTVKAESEGRNKGSRFSIRLPVSPLHAEALAPSQPRLMPPRDALAGVRVLVVDDDDDGRQLTAEILSAYGAEVAAASAADEAIGVVLTRPIDVVISDISLPGEDGYSLLRRLRSVTDGRAVAAVALTAHATHADAARAAEAGFERHFSKPFEPADLVDAIGEIAGRRAAAARPPNAIEAPPQP
jgi:PAS domain S-box-containing protein